MTGMAVGTVHLEAEVVLHVAANADLGGAPAIWARKNHLLAMPIAEPSSLHSVGIPFDKCDGVLEYNAALGTLPSAQGFTQGGSGPASDWVMSDNGVLRYSGSSYNYWSSTYTLPAKPDRMYTGMVYRVDPNTLGATARFGHRGTYSRDAEVGLRYALSAHAKGAIGQGPALRDAANVTYLPGLEGGVTTATPLSPPMENQWHNLTMGTDENADYVAWYDGYTNNLPNQWLPSGAFPLVGNVLGLYFGETDSYSVGQIDASVQYAWSSTPGRFIRARFQSYAPGASPTLRLYLTSDSDTAETLARFKVTYGTDPYILTGTSVSATASFVAKHQIFEVPLTLAGLSADAPFWFTVEREWGHADDKTRATVWLDYATVRSA